MHRLGVGFLEKGAGCDPRLLVPIASTQSPVAQHRAGRDPEAEQRYARTSQTMACMQLFYECNVSLERS